MKTKKLRRAERLKPRLAAKPVTGLCVKFILTMSADNPNETQTMPSESASSRRSSISRNAGLNMLGSVIPILISLGTVPPYLRLIGDVRYGVLALVWVFLGYAGLFEMGLGRATSKYIAELRSASDAERSAVFWTAAGANLAVGMVGGILLWAVAGLTLPLWVKSDPVTQAEVARALPWMAAAVPLATVSSVLIGALEGCEQFGVLNAQNIGATVLVQIVPLCVAYWIGPKVDLLISAVVLSRMVANVPLLYSCARHVPLRHSPRIDRAWIRRLFSFGAWITVSGIVSPILASLDRFVIGFSRGAQAVTYYSIPYTFATKLWIIPGSLQRALFPRLSAQRSLEAKDTTVRGVFALTAILTPPVVMAILGVGWFFRLWIGSSAAARCTPAAELLLAGVWINSLAHVPYDLLQSQGRPDLTARFHLLELAPFVGLLWAGIHFAGVTGAALVWVIRVSADATLLFVAAGIMATVWLRIVPSMMLMLAALGLSRMIDNHLLLRLIAISILTAISLPIAHATSPNVSRFISLRLRGMFAGGGVLSDVGQERDEANR
jgi:O-antigen/teichoic acid export membrane protein